MKSFRQYIIEVITFKNNSSWVLSPHGFDIKPSNKEHPDLFTHLDFMGRETTSQIPFLSTKTKATSWGRIDHDNKLIHIVTQNGRLAPNPSLRKKAFEEDVFSRLQAIPHLRERFPEYRIHYGGSSYGGTPNIQTHSYSEHEKYLTDLIKEN